MLPWRFFFAACVALTSCEPTLSGPAIPAPTSVVVRDAGSVISVPVHLAEGCPATTERGRWGRGTLHGASVTGREIWSREGSPHRVPHGIHLLAGSTLTVAPCAVVIVGAGRDIVVQADSRLRAEGRSSEPILFGSASEHPRPGDWMGFEVRAQALPGTRFAHAIIEHAGAAPAQRGDPSAAIRSWQSSGLELDEVTVRDSSGSGVALLGDSGFSRHSRSLRISGIEGPAVIFFADVDQVRTLPDGDYRGNESNEILLSARRRELRTDGTWRNPGPGVRYRVRRSARVLVQGVDAPRMVIAPGTAVVFEDDAELDVGSELPGALVADGEDARRPVVFSSAREPIEAASWVGLVFGEHTDTAHSRLRFVTIEAAGARAMGSFVTCPLDDGAALEPSGMIILQGVHADTLITHTEFRMGAPGGAAILASGDSLLGFTDFTATSHGNIFALAGVRCEQNAAPRRGVCPSTWRCHGGNPGPSTAQARSRPSAPP